MNWTSPDEFEWKEPHCETCKFRDKDPLVCEPFPDGKPDRVIFCDSDCPEHQVVAPLESDLSFGQLKQKVMGGIYGLVVGDALGVPVEFNSRQTLRQHPVTTMTGYGTYNQPPGTWSDDSTMTFCLMENLSELYYLRGIAEKFREWLDEAHWTPHGHVFDIGRTTLESINRYKNRVKTMEIGGRDESDNGNGSLMRILPLAYYLRNYKNGVRKFQIIHDVSALTHAHMRSQLGCSIYVELAIQLLRGAAPRAAVEAMKDTIRQRYHTPKWQRELAYYNRIMRGGMQRFEEEDIRSSGYVVHSLEAAIWCLLTSSSYEETVLKAVNLGEDTDTTAAVAGGLAGLYYGYEQIPSEWIQALARKQDIQQLIERFTKRLADNPL